MRPARELPILPPEHPLYPKALKLASKPSQPPVLHYLGDASLLGRPLLALFCARRCPARLIVKAQDWARSIRDQDVTIISGFHTPVELECLRVLLKGSCALIVCPARGLPKRIPPEWREPIEEGRLLVLSFFPERQVRPTGAMAQERNRYVAALAGKLFFLHAPAGSRSLALAQAWILSGKPLVTLPDPENEALQSLGATPVEMRS